MQAALESAAHGALVMVIEDVFTISGRGTVVTGTVQAAVSEDDVLALTDTGGNKIKDVPVAGIEVSGKAVKKVSAGDYAGLLLGGVGKKQAIKGMKLYMT